MRRLLSALAILAVAPACGDSGSERARASQRGPFSADLRPVNGSEVRGTARLTPAGDQLRVRIDAGGLEPDRVHDQHIQGLAVAGQKARCPSAPSDDNRDGLAELAEGMDSWGRSVRALQPFPTVGTSGRLHYDLTLKVDPKRLGPLDNRVLVLRGRSADRDRDGIPEYIPDLPVACGELRSLGDERL